jgi:hypothetical protein
LHFLQPLARLTGRLRHGLTPWRRRGEGGLAVPRARQLRLWCERGKPGPDRLESIARRLAGSGGVVRRGGEFDRWDLELRGGPLAAVRLRMAVEEHAGGQQLVRLRAWPRTSLLLAATIATCAALAAWAGVDRAYAAAGLLAGLTLSLLAWWAAGAGAALAEMMRAIADGGEERG